MTTYKLYGLRAKNTEEIKYIGITSRSLKERLGGHRFASKQPENKYKVCTWFRNVGADNVEIVLLNTYDTVDEMKQAEKDKIKELRSEGHDLLNHTDGGDGMWGFTPWNKGIRIPEDKLDPERFTRRLGTKHTEEDKERIRVGVIAHFEKNGHKSVYEYWVDKYGAEKADEMKEEWFKKRSKSLSGERNPMYGRRGKDAPCFGRTGAKHPMFGRTHSDETKAKISASSKGKSLPTETKVRMSLAQHTRFHTNKGIDKKDCVWCNGSSIEDEIKRRSSEHK